MSAVRKKVFNHWSKEELAELRRLFALGYSATQIVKELGGKRSRNAVIGTWHRLGLERGGTATNFRVEQMQRQRPVMRMKLAVPAKGVPLAPLEPPPPPAAPTPAGPTYFFDLKTHSCRWPMHGVGLGITYCGGNKIEGSSYCLVHTHMSRSCSRGLEHKHFIDRS
jgi:hypothetical protein